MSVTNRFQRGSGMYQCRCCKRNTRSVGNGDSEHVRLCVQCYDLAGEQNTFSDTGAFYAGHEEVLRLINEVAEKGGNAAYWDDLKADALKFINPQQEQTMTKQAINLSTLKASEITDMLSAKAISKADAIAELTRRIDKRAAAGKHPMPHIVALRDKLAD